MKISNISYLETSAGAREQARVPDFELKVNPAFNALNYVESVDVFFQARPI